MAVLKCKMCGGDLNFENGAAVVECEYCGTKQTVPNVDSEKKITLFGRANRLRYACEFDKASGIYESIVTDFPEEAEAYWGWCPASTVSSMWTALRQERRYRLATALLLKA